MEGEKGELNNHRIFFCREYTNKCSIVRKFDHQVSEDSKAFLVFISVISWWSFLNNMERINNYKLKERKVIFMCETFRTIYSCVIIKNRCRKNSISTVRHSLYAELRMLNLWIGNRMWYMMNLNHTFERVRINSRSLESNYRHAWSTLDDDRGRFQ